MKLSKAKMSLLVSEEKERRIADIIKRRSEGAWMTRQEVGHLLDPDSIRRSIIGKLRWREKVERLNQIEYKQKPSRR